MRNPAACASSRPAGAGNVTAASISASSANDAVRQDAGAHDPVADGETGHVRPDGQDLAAGLDARREGQFRPNLVLTAAEQHVGEVHGRRHHPHAELPGTDLEGRHVRHAQCGRRLADGRHLPGLHGRAPASSLACSRPMPASHASGWVARAW